MTPPPNTERRRGPFLRAPFPPPPGWPPDVAPNQVIRAAHMNEVRDSVYAWPGDVNGQFHTLSNVNLVNATGVLTDPTTTAGDLLVRNPVGLTRLPVGTQGQILTVDTALPDRIHWAPVPAAPVASVFGRVGAILAQAGDYNVNQVTGAMADPTIARGDLIVRGAAAVGRLPVGTDGQVLIADAAAALGVRWGGVLVTSVFGRTGAILAQAGDYTAAQVTNAVSTLGSYPDPVWIPSYAYSKLIGVPAQFPPSPHTHDAAAIVSGVIATARLGTGVADQQVFLRGDGTWAATGTGGGGAVISVFGRAGNVIAETGDYTAAQVTGAVVNPTIAPGDLMVRDQVGIARLPVGATGQVLQADTTLAVRMKWTTITAATQTPWVTNINAAGFELQNAGNIGIGKATPLYPLDVVGDVNITGVYRVNGVPIGVGGQTPWLQNVDASGYTLFNVGQIGVGVITPQGPLHIREAADENLIFGTLGGVTTIRATNDAVNAYVPLQLYGSRHYLMGGNVGINTTNPLARLHVLGGTDNVDAFLVSGAENNKYLGFQSGPSYASIFHWNGAGYGNLCLNPAGNDVGIATTNPQGRLHVREAVDENLIFGALGGVTTIRATNDAVNAYIPLQLYGSRHYLMGGNVGINTTNPLARLHVLGGTDNADTLLVSGAENSKYLAFQSGPSHASIFHWNGTGYGNLCLCPAGGNTGIGTPDPQGKLDVKGSGRTALRIGDAAQPANDYAIGRDVGSGLLILNGMQPGFSGYHFEVNNGTTVLSITNAGRLGVGVGDPLYKQHLYGAGQDGANGIYWPNLGTEATLYLQDSGIGAGNGGAILVGSQYGPHGAIKGFVTNGSGPVGDIAFYLRPTPGDSGFGEKMRLYPNGDLNIAGRYLVNGAPPATGAQDNIVTSVAYCSGPITLNTGFQIIPGCTLNLPARAGRYLILGCFDFVQGNFNDTAFNGALFVQSADWQNRHAEFVTGGTAAATQNSGRASVYQQWVYPGAVGGEFIDLRARAFGPGGSAPTGSPRADLGCSLCAIWISP